MKRDDVRRSEVSFPSQRGLRRDLGFFQAIAFGVGGTVGGGIFVLVGVAASLAGPTTLLSFIAAFAAAMLLILPYAELSSRFPLAGGSYAYTQHVLGSRWGFLNGWDYLGAYVFISGYVTLSFGGYLESIAEFPAKVGAMMLIGVVTVLNLAGIRLSGRAQTAVVATAVAGLLSFAIWGASSIETDSLVPFAPNRMDGVIAAALVAFLSFGGFDIVATAGEEIRNPERNLPRALIATVAWVLGLYLLVSLVAIGTTPVEQLGTSKAPLVEATEGFAGTIGARLTVVVALLTTAATANAILVATSRVAFAMARDRLLPSMLSKISRRTRVPWLAVVFCGGLLAIAAGVGTVQLFIPAGGFLYVLHFVPPLIALVLLRRKEPAAQATFSTPYPRLVIPLAFIAIAGLLFSAGAVGWGMGILWLGAGLLTDQLHNRRGPT